MSDARLELAYDAAAIALSQQDTTLGNLRNRATALLTAAALVTSFSTGVGLVNTDPARGEVLPVWTALALLAILVAIGILSTVVLWPVKSWRFGPDSTVILKGITKGDDVNAIRKHVAEQMTAGRNQNGKKLAKRTNCYRGGVVLLVLEVIVLVLALMLS